MDVYEELHEAIARGDKELVRCLLLDHSPEKHFIYEGNSALYKAFYCKEYNIASHLIRIGAKFDDSEDYDSLEIDLDLLNCHLMEYNRRPETSSIFRLISCSQSPQGLDRERLTAVMSMYEEFFKSEIMKWLMKVVESVALDIVYDFESEDVNRIHRYNVNESEIYGLTLTSSKEIYIGAKALLSDDTHKRAKVYGVVAEELCHLALDLLFENDAKPYREEDLDSEKDLQDIVLGVKSLIDRSCHIESVIVDVFRNYTDTEWECELIARVPHVIGIYGQEYAKTILQESPELLKLMNFYQQNVIPTSERYADPTLNTRGHRKMEELRENDLLSYKEKTIKPLKQGFPSFRKFCVEEEGISVVTTNCLKLCTLQVYHELKMQYKDLFQKKCLFFGRKCLNDKWKEIEDALKVNLWDYFILVLDEKELTLQGLKREYLDHFDSFKSIGLKMVVILGSQSLGDEFQRQALNYGWKNLSSEYQYFRTHPVVYILKGEERKAFIEKKDVPKFFQSETDILRIISGEPFMVKDGADLESQGFILETYLDREFKVMALNKLFLENLSPNTCVFIYGLYMWHLEKLAIDRALIQWLKSCDDEIKEDKNIFIIEDGKTISLSEFKGEKPTGKSICLHFLENEFFLSNADSLHKDLKMYEKEIRIKEEEIIDVLKRNKILIISDNAGCGKSTVTSSLVRRVKKKISDSWVFRIDLWKFSLHDDFDFEDSDDEEVFDEVFETIGLVSGFEKWHFKQSWNQKNYFIFFDGYDETPSKYKSKTLELISFLRRRTHVNIVITARRHEQQELEERLNTYSHQLVPFNDEEQVNCLGKLLKWKLKYPFGEKDPVSQKNRKAISKKIKNIIKVLGKEEESYLEQQQVLDAIKNIELGDSLESVRLEIDKLDLKTLVVNILKKTILEKRIIEFMGIPLHLYMVGSILYFDNFNVQIGADVYSLYSKFIEHKIQIYVEEKEGYSKEGNEKDRMVNRVREDAFKIHIQLADDVFNEGKVTELEEKDLCISLGIVSIHGGKTLFLHQTFAEFFKAESIRRNVEKKDFIKIISYGEYEVVRIFLSSAFEKKGFENISEEISTDLDFLYIIINRIYKSYTSHSSKFVFYSYKIDSDLGCCLKIVKQLVKVFKLSDEPEMIIKFIAELNTFVNGKINEAIFIGCCLNAEIIKLVINKNVDCKRFLILGFVRLSENAEEVIDVLKEFIFKRSKRGGNEEERVLKRILKVLGTEDSDENGLICYAIWNESTEIFPCLLEYLKNVLGKERFVREIIASRDYQRQTKLSIINMHTNRNCGLIKKMHSKFENDINIVLDIDFKFRLILKAARDDNVDESSNSFEKVRDLFIECFGNANLKEVLQNGNSVGEYLVHQLMEYSTNANLIKYLDLIKNVSDGKMKDFLKIKDEYLRNIFHFAAQNTNEINFNFLDLYLSDYEIKELLIARDEFGRTCLHYTAYCNPRQLSLFMNFIFKKLNSEKSVLEELLLTEDENGYTFLHSIGYSFDISSNQNKKDEIIQYCKKILESID